MFFLKKTELLIIFVGKTVKASFYANMEKLYYLSLFWGKKIKKANQIVKKVNC